MYRPLIAAQLILLTACPEDVSTLPPTQQECESALGDGGYFPKAELQAQEPWYYRQTVVSSHGPFLGVTRLWRIQWLVQTDRLSAVVGSNTVASWRIEETANAVCERGSDGSVQVAAQQEGAPNERAYLVVDWTKSSVENNLFAETTRSLTFTAASEVMTDIELSKARIDITESGHLSLDPVTCEEMLSERSGPVACEGTSQLRHVFRPVSAIAKLSEPRPIPQIPQGLVAQEFGYFGSAERVEHMSISEAGEPLRFHVVSPEQNGAAEPTASVVAAASQIDEVLRAAWPEASQPRLEVQNATAEAPRMGGLEANTVTWTTGSGFWGSFTSRAVDPITGEVVAGDLIIDQQHVAQAVEAVRGHMDDNDPSIEGLLAFAQGYSRRTIAANPAAIIARSDALPAATTTLDEQLLQLRAFRDHPVSSIVKDDRFAGLAAGHDWREGDQIPEGLMERVWPDDQVKRVVDASQSQATSFMLRAGYSYPDTTGWAGFEHLAVDLAAMHIDDASELVRDGLSHHLVLRGLLQLLGLRTNPAGSTDALNFPDAFWNPQTETSEALKTSSIMDELPAEQRPFATRLGRYDVAALRFLFGDQIEVFETAPPVDVSILDTFQHESLPLRFCGEPCPDPAVGIRALTQRRFVPASQVSASGLVTVPYKRCDAITAAEARTPGCGLQDYGASAQEIIGHAIGRWMAHYPFVAFGTERQPVNPSQLMRPAMQVVAYASIVAQWLINRAKNDRAFSQTEQASDWASAAFMATQFAAEVLATPERTRMCPWPGATVYIPWRFLNDCYPEADLDSEVAIAAQMIEIPLGIGRTDLLGPARPWVEAGSYFDKQNILWMLRIVYPTTLPSQPQAPGLSLYHLFHEVLAPLYEDVIRVDDFFLRAEVAENLGGYWCRDPDAPNVAHLGSFVPRDIGSGGPPAQCINPAAVYPTMHGRMNLSGLFWSLALPSPGPGLDAAATRAKLFRVGMDDGGVDWNQFSFEELCEFTNARTGATYRSILADHPLGCELILRAREAQESWMSSNDNPFYERNFEAKQVPLELVRALLP